MRNSLRKVQNFKDEYIYLLLQILSVEEIFKWKTSTFASIRQQFIDSLVE